MSTRVKIVVGPGGPVAVKTATTPTEVARLAHEATRLRRAAHPGIVSFLAHQVVDETQAELHTRYAGRSLDLWQGDLSRLAGLGAAVAATLADLHELGIVHGGIDPTHVVVGLDGRPRLCGLSALDPGLPADDVAALGRLLGELAERLDTERRGAFARRRAPYAERRSFENLLTQATLPTPERRPSARALAGALLVAVPDAELPPAGPWMPAPAAILARNGLEPLPEPTGEDPADLDDLSIAEAAESALDVDEAVGPHIDDGLEIALGDRADDAVVLEVFGDQSDTAEEELFVDRPWQITPRPSNGGPRHSRSTTGGRHRTARVAAGVGVGVVVVGLAYLLVQDHGPPTTTPQTQEDALPRQADDTAGTSPPCPPSPAEAVAVDVDGDGCGDAVEVVDGLVRAGDERWAVGDPGDVVAVGDWDCDGAATPAVYRPSTGDVFVFEAWADDARPLATEPTAQVAAGVTLTADRGDDGCDAPVVGTRSGEQHTVEVDR